MPPSPNGSMSRRKRRPAKSEAGSCDSSQPSAESISLVALADRFIEAHDDMGNRSFAFVLGAGASRSSGIKTASEMVADWIQSLYRQATGDTIENGSGWATAETLKIDRYDPSDPAASYSELYRRMYLKDPDRGYAYLEAQMHNSEPSYGYSVLARIMESTRHKLVVTTNFDNLVADSLSIFSQTYPLVCGHGSLAPFISVRARRPLVVKVHRDLLLAPKSTPEDVSSMPRAFEKGLAELFRHYTPIVIGYGGNDRSLMSFLKSLPDRSIPGGVYWCHRESGPPPSQEIVSFVNRQAGCLVPIPGFDEAMMLLGNRLRYPVPDKFLLDRAQRRADRIVEQAKALQSKLAPSATATMQQSTPSNTTLNHDTGTDAPVLEKQTPGINADNNTSASAPVDVELAKAILDTMQRADGQRRWWQWDNLAQSQSDPQKTDQIYRDAIVALPNSAPLLGNYALFLAHVQRDYNAADAMYKRAIEIGRGNASILGNYALFLAADLRDPDAADAMYKMALEADPAHANNLGNYANFLAGHRRDLEAAEALYKKCLEYQPVHAVHLANYALLLMVLRKDYDSAEALFNRALEAQPDNANILGSYAVFLMEARNDHAKAEAMFKRSLEIDPKDANTLGNYAAFQLAQNSIESGLKTLDQALAAIRPDANDALAAELWMYATCHWLPDRWREAPSRLKALLIDRNIKTADWDFTGVVSSAKARGHPDAEWLDRLARVCSGTAKAPSLDGWVAWMLA